MQNTRQQSGLRQAIEELDQQFSRKWLIDEPVIVDQHQLLQCLYEAVESRDVPLVGKLLEQKPQLNQCDILWIAVEDDDTEIATMLVRAGADLQQTNPHNRQGLVHVLVASSNPKKHQLAMLMIQKGAEIHLEDDDGRFPIDRAVANDDIALELVKQLISAGAIVDEVLIREAARKPKAALLLPILAKGHFTSAKTMDSKVALMVRCLVYNMDLDESVVIPLIETLFALGKPDDDMALHIAVVQGKLRIVKLLLDKGLGARVLSKLLQIASILEYSSIIELLIERGADIDYRVGSEELGQFVLHTSCKNGTLLNVKLLLRLGADVNVVDSDGNTAFSLIDDTDLNDISREMIKHFAMLTSDNLKINKSDMELVQSRQDFSNFYQSCLNELKEMKGYKIFNHISLHTVLFSGSKRLSWLTRNCTLVEKYNEANIKCEFPLYYSMIELRFRHSERRKNLLLSREQAASEIFNRFLPDLVVAEIIYKLYMNDV